MNLWKECARYFALNLAIIAVLMIVSALLTGCTSTRVDYGTFHLHRVSFAQSVDVVVTKEGDNFKVQYGNDGGSATGGKIAEGITTGVLIGK